MNSTRKSENYNMTELVQLMMDHDIAPTNQRLDVARVLLCRFQHLCADQVYDQAKANGSSISRATVYNTLKLFSQRGLVRQVIIHNNKVFFDSNVADHHHIYNEDTGELTDVTDDEISLTDLPELPPSTVATGVDIIIRVKNS